MRPSLLEQAKKKPVGRHRDNFPQGEIDLALAWARKDLSNVQVSTTLKLGGGAHLYVWLALRLRASGIANRNGRR